MTGRECHRTNGGPIVNRHPHIPIAVLALLAACGPAPSAPAPLVAAHLAYDDPAPGRVPHGHDGRTIHLDPEPVFTDADFARASSIVRPGEVLLSVELTAEAGRRLAARTAANIGASLALLGDGEVVNVARIVSPVGGSGPLVIGGFGPATDGVGARVAARWPPGD